MSNFDRYKEIFGSAFQYEGNVTELKYQEIPAWDSVGHMQLIALIEDAFDIVGKPAALEYKYDGFRLQVHKYEGGISLFTRRLENVTHRFPDVVMAVKNGVKVKDCILDAEAVGYNPDTKKYLPFQSISQRIKRKYDYRFFRMILVI